MGVYYFPSNFVFWKKISKHETVKNRILEFINTNPKVLETYEAVSNGKSSYNNKVMHDFFSRNGDICNSIIWETLEDVVRELNSKESSEKVNISSSFINGVWCSKYDANSTVSCHNHEGDGNIVSHIDGIPFKLSFSILYIVNDTNVSNKTEFIQPSSHRVSAYGNSETRFNTSEMEDIGEGTVLVFPTNLYHQVNQMIKPGRVIISANISSHFIGT